MDWETNPPINGFYEMMMVLTSERRKELREMARLHNEKQLVAAEVKTAPETSHGQPRHPGTQSEVSALFPEMEAEKPKEEAVGLSPRPYHRTPEMHLREGSLVASRTRDIGYLKDITPYGATFQPLGLTGYQKETSAKLSQEKSYELHQPLYL